MKKYIIIFISLCCTKFIEAQDSTKITWSLEDCLNYAVKNNITVKKATLNKNTAELNYQQSKNNKLPGVSGSASYTLSTGTSIDAITSDYITRVTHSNSFGLSGQLTLYQGNTLNLQIAKNKLLINENDLYVKEAENNIRLNVLEAYLQALYYYEGINIAVNTAHSSEEELKQAQVKYTNGALARKDLADLETQHSANEYSIVTSKNLYAQQVLSLKQLLELEPGVAFQIQTPQLTNTSQNAIPNKQEVFEAAINYLPDLKIYDVQREEANKDLQIAKAGFKPTVSLSAGMNTGYTSTMNYNYFNQLRNNYGQQISLSVNIPIFEKYQNKTNVALARINIQQSELSKISASKDLYAKIETAWQNAVANQAQQISSGTARDNAKLAYDLAIKKYEFGGLTTTELAVSRNNYLNAEQNYIQSKYLALLYQQLLNYYQGKPFSIN